MSVRLRLGAAMVAVAAVTSACDGSRTDVLAAATDRIATIRSGDLDMSFVMRDSTSRSAVGFSLEGPFSLDGARIPIADLEYAIVAGATQERFGFVSDGQDAFVEVDGTVYLLPRERSDAFAGFTQAPGDGAIPGLDLESWFRAPRVTGRGEIAGAETQVIEGDVDVPVAIAGLLEVLSAFGGNDVPTPSPQDRAMLVNAVRDASLVVEVGRDDRLLRRLSLDVRLAPGVERLADAIGSELSFELRISRPNEPVEVSAPAGATPLPS